LGRSLSATVSPAHFQNSLGRLKNNELNKNGLEYDTVNNIGLIGSSESCTSLVSTDISNASEADHMKKQGKKGWVKLIFKMRGFFDCLFQFRSSLGKAFRKKLKHPDVSMSDIEGDYYVHQSSDFSSRKSSESQNTANKYKIGIR